MKRTVVAVGALLLGIGAVMAQQNLVKQSQDTMKANAKNLGVAAFVQNRATSDVLQALMLPVCEG